MPRFGRLVLPGRGQARGEVLRKMPIRKSGRHLDGEPVIDYATCTFCGRKPLIYEEYGSGKDDWNFSPLTCPECFTKPENQRIIRSSREVLCDHPDRTYWMAKPTTRTASSTTVLLLPSRGVASL